MLYPFFEEAVMKDYLRSVSITNEIILNNTITQNELERFSKSDYRWANNRKNTASYKGQNIKKGEIYQFEFGKNYVPEMSYEHRGLVIGVNGRLLYVLPIFSYDPKHDSKIYDSEKNAKGDLYRLEQACHSFLKHDSLLKLNDIRTISVNRILYRQKDGKIDISSKEFLEIQRLAFTKYFPTIAFDYNKNNEALNEVLDANKKLIEENILLKEKIQELESKIENTNKENAEV